MPFLNYKNSKIHYLQFGSGPKLLIALHGFADVAETYKVLESVLAKRYTVLALDLPFHGKTEWSKAFFTKKDIQNLIDLLAQEAGFQRFSLMGHSMGTRLIMKVLPKFVDRVEGLYFLAPDGIKIKGPFNMNLTPVWLRQFLKKRLTYPQRLQAVVRWLYNKGLVQPIVNKFVQVHLSNPRKRNRLMGTWISLADFITYPWRFARLLNEKQISIDLYYGKKDEIIPVKGGKRFCKSVPHAKLHVLESNHRLINEELASRL